MGHNVIVIDNFSSTANDTVYRNKNVKYHSFDIAQREAGNLFKHSDFIFHLAAESRIPACLKNPSLAIKTNIKGTCNVLEWAKKYKTKRVVFSSTSAAYGLVNLPPHQEEMKTDCLNPYSITKVAAEDFCKMYYHLYDVPTTIFRYFNVYGERQPTRGQYAPVVGLFQKQFAKGEAMTVVGDGLQTRDYVHVSDVVEANIKAISHESSGGRCIPKSLLRDQISAEIFNIGTGTQHSVLDLVHMIAGKDANYKHLPPRSGEARNTCADITKAQDILDWKPKIKLEDWIKENS